MMGNKILIIGSHPIISDMTRQYCQRGDEVIHYMDDDGIATTDLTAIREIVLLPDNNKPSMEADNETMRMLEGVAAKYASVRQDDKRLLCHLLLRSHSLLHLIRLEGFRQEIEDSLEVNPFTIEDQWSQTIALSLDREPMTIQSGKTVHLVIFGMSQVAEQVAMNAVHVCHFPNYICHHSYRTRITVIDESAFEKSKEWIQRYKPLFDNCYYRYVDTQKNPAVTNTSKPVHQDREDFVDIEWEFVSASPYDNLVNRKIEQWSTAQSQILTIVFANGDSEAILNQALHLPEVVVASRIPVYVYMQNDEAFRQIKRSDCIPHMIPFGMVEYGYDVNIPLVKMAKNVNFIYNRCAKDNEENWNGHMRFSVEIDEEQKEIAWKEVSGVKRMSNIYNAMTIGVKMRSMGFKEDDWDKFYDMSQEVIETLAEVEHNRWSVEELMLGWRPCTDQEQREVESDIRMKEILKKRKIHYDLRAYKDLRPDSTGRPVQIYDRCLSACIPLIAKESRGGEI